MADSVKNVHVVAIKGKDGVVPDPSWGTVVELGGTILDLNDIEGKNKNAIWDDENDPQGSIPDLESGKIAPRTPSEQHELAAAYVQDKVVDSIKRLHNFRKEAERTLGQAVTKLAPGDIKAYNLFSAQKAMALNRLGRTPSDIEEFMVPADGNIGGEATEARKVFCQRFRPTAKPTGRVIVVAPGYHQHGRFYYDQVSALNAQGDEVVVMDQMWAGKTGNKPAYIDRGYGIARDIAAVVAHVQKNILEKENRADAKMAILATSMSGGGASAFLVARALGTLHLKDGAEKNIAGDIDLVLQAPYFWPTSKKEYFAARYSPDVLRHRTFVRRGSKSDDKVQAQRIAQLATQEEVYGRLSALVDSLDDLQDLFKKLAQTSGRLAGVGAVRLVMSEGDVLAKPQEAKKWMDELSKHGVDVQIRWVLGGAHSMEMHRVYKHYVIEEFAKLIKLTILKKRQKAG